MMKYLLLLITPLLVFAQTYMGKVEPYEEFTIYSQTSGQITKLNKENETKIINGVLVKLDDALEQKHLKLYENQLALYNEKLKILENNYQRFLTIRGKSQTEKDEKYYDVIDLKITINNLKITIDELQDTITKKTIKVKNLYIKEFDVESGDYVATGAKIATAYNTTEAKIVVYIDSEDYKDIKNKKVLINGEENIAILDKVDITVDDTFVSAYKTTLKLQNKNFGEVVKVEFIK